MKKILYLCYHYDPDLSAGSFRNTALSRQLAYAAKDGYEIHLICTQPNRYSNLSETSPAYEVLGNLHIYRKEVPQHGNGFFKQILAFMAYRKSVLKQMETMRPDFIFASTSKLFTGFLAYQIARRHRLKLYIDLRDLFAENLKELIRLPIANSFVSWFVRTYFEIPCLRYAQDISINSEGFRNNIPNGFKGRLHFFPNGIDSYFLNWRQLEGLDTELKTVCYAGNIGEGQGLHKIIPELAKGLEKTHRFLLIGSGSALNKLKKRLEELKIRNVEFLSPMKRNKLLEYYRSSHYLFLHLNDFDSFKKVLPSKIFEYASGDLPIVAGVSGTARSFLEEEVKENVFLFDPCDAAAAIRIFQNANYALGARPEFVEKYDRQKITERMAESILEAFKDA